MVAQSEYVCGKVRKGYFERVFVLCRLAMHPFDCAIARQSAFAHGPVIRHKAAW